jgi:hypothetical protein
MAHLDAHPVAKMVDRARNPLTAAILHREESVGVREALAPAQCE